MLYTTTIKNVHLSYASNEDLQKLLSIMLHNDYSGLDLSNDIVFNKFISKDEQKTQVSIKDAIKHVGVDFGVLFLNCFEYRDIEHILIDLIAELNVYYKKHNNNSNELTTLLNVVRLGSGDIKNVIQNIKDLGKRANYSNDNIYYVARAAMMFAKAYGAPHPDNKQYYAGRMLYYITQLNKTCSHFNDYTLEKILSKHI